MWSSFVKQLSKYGPLSNLLMWLYLLYIYRILSLRKCLFVKQLKTNIKKNIETGGRRGKGWVALHNLPRDRHDLRLLKPNHVHYNYMQKSWYTFTSPLYSKSLIYFNITIICKNLHILYQNNHQTNITISAISWYAIRKFKNDQ